MLPDLTVLVENLGPSVVNVSTKRRSRGESPDGGPMEEDPFYDFFRRFMPEQPDSPEFQTRSLGSGFIVSDDGYVLTNRHVVAEADEILVRLNDRREFDAKVIGTDKQTDVAVLKIEAKGLPKAKIGDPTRLKVGEWVLAIGSPFGFESTVTKGIVSAKGRSLPSENYVPFIQTDAAINPGNSGGPLFNLRGEVVGINAQIYTRSGGYMGLSFAIPIDIAMNVSDQLRTDGKVTRGRLGVQIQEVTGELANSFGLPRPAGALVAGVEKGSPAEKAGVESGDVILAYNGKPIERSSDLPPVVATTKPGAKIAMEVWRKGSKKDLTVTVGELAGTKVAQSPEKVPATDSPLGLRLRALSVEEKEDSGLTAGLLVEAAKGVAARAGIQTGDVIVAVNNVYVDQVEEFRSIVKDVPRGRNVAVLIKRGQSALYIPIRVE